MLLLLLFKHHSLMIWAVVSAGALCELGTTRTFLNCFACVYRLCHDVFVHQKAYGKNLKIKFREFRKIPEVQAMVRTHLKATTAFFL